MSKPPIRFYTRLIVSSALILGSYFAAAKSVWAAPTPPGTSIENQATGSFEGETSGTADTVISNIVTLQVAEVAGITVTASGTSGSTLTGGIVYFDFILTNAGNDPTQFFIPSSPSGTVVGGNFNLATNPIQVVAYNPTGTTNIPVTGVTIPDGGQQTGPITATGTDGLLGKNGIIPAGGSVTIRVPITITATAGNPVTVVMGDTGTTPLGQNQVYSNNNNLDIYTQDNPDNTTNATSIIVETATGMPFNGDSINHRQEASASKSINVTAAPVSISGTVFEDVNYGGGAGRNLTTTGVVVRQNVRVEIYDVDGNYLGKTLTDPNGKYTFNAANATAALTASKTYQIRVVNSFVTSSRGGGCTQASGIDTPPASCTQIPVQTFRTSGDSNADSIWDADPNRVGGEQPAKIDAPANSGTQLLSALTTSGQTVASLTTVIVGTANINGVDFGYNFDTIVNTNDSGQGSLRQFITNSNALENTTLNQDPNPAPASGTTAIDSALSEETSIFMIPSTQLISGVANINVTSLLPQIMGVNASKTIIDGRTQTANIGNTNNIVLGTGGTVGVQALTLNQLNGPEVQIQGVNTVATGLDIRANDITVRGIAIFGFSAVGSTNANINIVSTASNPLITENAIGITATALVDPAAMRSGAYGIYTTSSSGNFTKNLVAFNGRGGIETIVPGTVTIVIDGNEIRGNAITDSRAEGTNMGGGGSGIKVTNNLFADNGGPGIDTAGSTGGNLYENNTVTNNGLNITNQTNPIPQTSGIRIDGASNIIKHNIIYKNYGAGILVRNTATNTLITENSIYENGTIGSVSGEIGIDLVATNSATLAATNDRGIAPFVTANSSVTAGGNGLLNFPVFSSTKIEGGELVVTGFAPATAKIELFIADDGPNHGSATSFTKVFGEGKTYLATATEGSTADLDTNSPTTYTDDGTGATSTKTANGFKFKIPLTGGKLNGQTITNSTKLTATATVAGATSEFSGSTTVTVSNPNLLLVKRITGINGSSFTGYEDSDSRYDDNIISTPTAPELQPDTNKWPDPVSNFLQGKIDGGMIKPNDSIEYTIYFISAGDTPANKVLFCDRVPANVTLIPNAFNSTTPDAAGLAGADRGIAIRISGSLKSYTNVADNDLARYFPPNQDPTYGDYASFFPGITDPIFLAKKICNGPNDNGAIVVNLGTIPNATSMNTPSNSNGFVRFQGRVK